MRISILHSIAFIRHRRRCMLPLCLSAAYLHLFTMETVTGHAMRREPRTGLMSWTGRVVRNLEVHQSNPGKSMAKGRGLSELLGAYKW
jgi:hypothetical protein